MAAADLAAWGVEGASGVRGTAARREDDARERAREAKRADARAAREAERLAYRTRAAEEDLAWRFAEGTADAFGLRGQAIESGGGVFDNGDTESEDAGESFYDTSLASTRLHLGLRESEHRRAVRRFARVEATLAEVPSHVPAIVLAYTPRPCDPDLRKFFTRLVEEVPRVEGGRAVTRTVKRKERKLITGAARARNETAEALGVELHVEEIVVEEEIPIVDEMTRVAPVELAIRTSAARTGTGAWLLKRGLTRVFSVDEMHVRRECLAWSVRQRQRDTASANLLGRVLRETTEVLDAAVAAYVAVGERARDARRAEREARAGDRGGLTSVVSE